MTALLYPFIATKTTADLVVPAIAASQTDFNRKVAGAISAGVGGHLTAGDLKFRSVSDAIPNHLLCDGSTVEILSFPDLYDVIGITHGGDGVTTFALPDYINTALTTAATAPAQTTDEGGTVSNEDTAVTEPTEPGETGGTIGGNVPSGGRPRRTLNEAIP